jgi:hypothetical protein
MPLFEIPRLIPHNFTFPYLSPVQILAGCTGNDKLYGFIRSFDKRNLIYQLTKKCGKLIYLTNFHCKKKVNLCINYQKKIW